MNVKDERFSRLIPLLQKSLLSFAVRRREFLLFHPWEQEIKPMRVLLGLQIFIPRKSALSQK